MWQAAVKGRCLHIETKLIKTVELSETIIAKSTVALKLFSRTGSAVCYMCYFGAFSALIFLMAFSETAITCFSYSMSKSFYIPIQTVPKCNMVRR